MLVVVFFIQRVSEQMDQMEFKDNRMEIERTNNKRLLEEIKHIVVRMKWENISFLLFVILMNDSKNLYKQLQICGRVVKAQS